MISETFINSYIKQTPPFYITVYLYIVCEYQKGKRVERKNLLDIEYLMENDINRALTFWEKESLLKVVDDVIILNQSTKQKNEEILKNNLEPKVKNTQNTLKPENIETKIVIETKPNYLPQELEHYKNTDENVKKIFELSEKTFGNLLNFNDLSIIFGLYDWLKLPFEVIEVLLNYCRDQNKTDLRYLEKVAIDWSNKNIDTKEKAIKNTQKVSGVYMKVKKALGASGDLTTKEIQTIDKWLEEFSLEMIIEACEMAVMSKKANYNYVSGTLRNWLKENIKTLDDVYKKQEQFISSIKNTTTKEIPKRNKFANFTQEGITKEEMDKITQEKIRKILEG